MSVVLPWVDRGKHLEAMNAHSFFLDMTLMVPLAAFTPRSQAGMCCQVKPGVRFLEDCALAQRVEKGGCPTPTPHFVSVSVRGFGAHGVGGRAGRSLTTQQHSAAFATPRGIKKKPNNNQPQFVAKSLNKCEQAGVVCFFFPFPFLLFVHN